MSSKWEDSREDWRRDKKQESRSDRKSETGDKYRRTRGGNEREDREDREERDRGNERDRRDHEYGRSGEGREYWRSRVEHTGDRETDNRRYHKYSSSEDVRHDRRRRRSRSPESIQRSREAPGEEKEPEAEKPNYKQSGLLARESKKTSSGKVLKYFEPEDSVTPPKLPQYRLYIFSKSDQDEIIDTIKLDQRSWYLLGRDISLAHIPLLSAKAASGQHAALQFRLISNTNRYGEKTEKTKLYVIDLESTNGTTLNGDKLPSSRYVEIKDKDVLKFADSEDMVLMVS